MKKIYNSGLIIIISTTIFWLIYTVVFLFIDGWHFKAISQIEKLCDIITNISWRIGITLWLISVASLVHQIMKGGIK